MDRDAILAAMLFGGGLPGVTSSDNGKVLGVDDGEWGAVADKGKPFYVNFTIMGAAVDNVYPLSADKTLAEIDAAIDAGYDIIAVGSLDSWITLLTARISSIQYDANDALDFVGFSLMGQLGNSPVLGTIEYTAIDGAFMKMFPLQEQLPNGQGVNF